MNNWIELILPLFCLILALINLIKYFSYKNRFSLVGFIPILYFFSIFVGSFLALELSSIEEFIAKVTFQKFIYTALSLGFSTFFMGYILLSVEDWQSKKIKTLLRIPLIGALIAHLLQPQQVIILISVLELTLIILSNRSKEKNSHIKRLQRKQTIFYPLLIISIFTNSLLFCFLFLVFTWPFKNAILNAMVIKNIIYNNNQLETNV